MCFDMGGAAPASNANGVHEMTIKEKEKQKDAFVNGMLGYIKSKGISIPRVKNDSFPSYATGNRRLEHKHGELNLNDIFNMAQRCRMTAKELILSGIENMDRTGGK